MATITKLKEPVIELVKADELLKEDLVRLIAEYETDRSEFVICDRGFDKILINTEYEKAAELKELTRKLMNCEALDHKAEKLFDSFKDMAGKKAYNILFCIWYEQCKENKKKRNSTTGS